MQLCAVMDKNNNCLSDVYEFIYFGGPTAAPFTDLDGDGVTTFDEMFWGTNPTNGTSKVTGPTVVLNGSDMFLHWPIAPFRRYALHASSNLQSWVILTNAAMPPFPEPLVFSGPQPSRFYRLTVTFESQDINSNGLINWEQALYEQHFGDPRTSSTDLDRDGLNDAEEFQQGRNFLKKDHPAVGLVVFTPLEK